MGDAGMIPTTLTDADLTTILNGCASERMEIVARIRSRTPPAQQPKEQNYHRKDGHVLKCGQGKCHCVNCGMEIPNYPDDQNLPQCPASEGLKLKYIISKVDGSPIDPDGDYFIIKLNSKTKWHREASIRAILEYAESVKEKAPQLAKDIIAKYGSRQHPAPAAPKEE